jgi:hypothetical protein
MLDERASSCQSATVPTNRTPPVICDYLSLVPSNPMTSNENPTSAQQSFYLHDLQCFAKHETRMLPMHSLPSISILPKTHENKQTDSLSKLATRRSIIRDLTSVSTSDGKVHHSIDSLFSKDSLLE